MEQYNNTGDLYNMKLLLENYFNDILIRYQQEIISPLEYSDILLSIACGYHFLEEKETWKEIGYDICKGIKQEVELFPIRDTELGMFMSFGTSCFSVCLFSQATGLLKGFSAALNNILLLKTNKFLERLNGKFETNIRDYDMVFGVSGILNYLLEFEWNSEKLISIKNMINYLISRSENYTYKDMSVVKYHIPVTQQAREDEKEDFPDGNVNFGLSHGLAGPLLALSKAFYRNIYVEGLKEAIDKLFEIYDTFQVTEQSIIRWPTQMCVQNFCNRQFDDIIYRGKNASWCYGNIGLACALRIASINMGNIKRKLFYENALKNIINRSPVEYHLNNIAICHGHAGVLYGRMNLFYQTNEFAFTQTLDEQLKFILETLKQYKDSQGNYDLDKISEELFPEGTFFLNGLSGLILSFLSVVGIDHKLGLILGYQ